MFLLNSEYSVALSKVNSALIKWSQNIELLCSKLNILRFMGIKTGALEVIRILLTDNGKIYVPAIMAVARYFLANRRFIAAESIVIPISRDFPNNRSIAKILQDISIERIHYNLRIGNKDFAEYLIESKLSNVTSNPQLSEIWIDIAINKELHYLARQRMNMVLKNHPDIPSIKYKNIQLYMLDGDYQTATKLIDIELRSTSQQINLEITKLDAAVGMHCVASALTIIKKLRIKYQNNPVVMTKVARFYYNNDRIKAARIVLEKCIPSSVTNINTIKLYYQVLCKGYPSCLIHALDNLQVKLNYSEQESKNDLIQMLYIIKLIPSIEHSVDLHCRESVSNAIILLANNINKLDEGNKVVLCIQAERYNIDFAVHASLQSIMTEGPVTPLGARFICKKIVESGCGVNQRLVMERMLKYMRKDQLVACTLDLLLLIDGPEAALATMRQAIKPSRTLREARKLFSLLEASNDRSLSLRYIRLCINRWPKDQGLRLSYAWLLFKMGHPNDALDALNFVAISTMRNSKLELKVQVLLELGLIEDACREISLADLSSSYKLFILKINILIVMGFAKEAELLIQGAGNFRFDKNLSFRHFSLSMAGMLLNDLLLFKLEESTASNKHLISDLSVRYNYPAIKTLMDYRSESPLRETESYLIPAKVVQYWDTSSIPDNIYSIMKSWKKSSSIEYFCFDYNKACAFLEQHYGSNYVRAFRLASNAAEGADFFRLCYLRQHGGIYADADDFCYGKIENLLLPNTGLVCFREGLGSLANNILAAVPNHPAIVHASEMAASALLARDNDATWSKTGPGLITRVVAHHLLNHTSELMENHVTILPLYLLRRNVNIHISLPYKMTHKHWNNNIKKTFNISDML